MPTTRAERGGTADETDLQLMTERQRADHSWASQPELGVTWALLIPIKTRYLILTRASGGSLGKGVEITCCIHASCWAQNLHGVFQVRPRALPLLPDYRFVAVESDATRAAHG